MNFAPPQGLHASLLDRVNQTFVLLPLLTAALLLCAAGCSDSVSPGESPDVADIQDQQSTESDAAVCLGQTCTSVTECGPKGPCVATISCVAGCCSRSYSPQGTPCSVGCQTGGTCNGAGECLDTAPVVCDDLDGNPCTAAACDEKTGKCSELESPVPDGTTAMTSKCWTDLLCQGGQPDTDNAQPTELNLSCQQADEELSPFGCVSSVVCVDSSEQCLAINKDNGTQCWSGSAAFADTCTGQSCVDGLCGIDPSLNVSCGEENYPADCDSECRDCTELNCHWVPDPNAVGQPTKKVRYCQPKALVSGECDDGNECTRDDVCVLGGQTEGLLGKETFGKCQPGEGKTKADCLADMEYPDLACLKEGVSCTDQEGCAFDQDAADEFCYPQDSVCFDQDGTYCTHLDPEDGFWNDETGCHVPIVDIDCDDANPCTIDKCKQEDDEFFCEHKSTNGAACDDGNPCSVGDQCIGATCTGDPKCIDLDDNPCTTVECSLEGVCTTIPDDQSDCSDNDPCTTDDACSGGVCVGSTQLDCNDDTPCTSDSCVAGVGCHHGSAPDGTACGTNDHWSCLDGLCECSGDCTGLACGDDGCGGSCGLCEGPQDICVEGSCVCQPFCDGLSCGDDGCGGSCGTCKAGNAVCVDHQCIKLCELPGCGCEDLSGCGPGTECIDGFCVECTHWIPPGDGTTGGTCADCTQQDCDGAGMTGETSPWTSLEGQCICETLPGYFWPASEPLEALPCDGDGDGWLRATAAETLASADLEDDSALLEQWRCDYRWVDVVILHPDGGLPITISLADLGQEFGLAQPLALVEPVLLDDQLALQAAVEDNQQADMPGYLSPSGMAGTVPHASDLNAMTKVCVDEVADFNQNGVADIQEWWGDKGIATEYRAAGLFAYFLELNRGWYEPEAGTCDGCGAYHIQERPRSPEPDSDASAWALALEAGEDQGTYWRECRRYPDAKSAKPGVPHITMDMAGWTALLELAPGAAMGHHSQFKCLALAAQPPLPADTDGLLHWEGGNEAASLYTKGAASVCDNTGCPSAQGTCDAPGCPTAPRFDLNRCGFIPGANPPLANDVNPTDPGVQCSTDVTFWPGDTRWGVVRYPAYQDEYGVADYPALESQHYYRMGCINECTELHPHMDEVLFPRAILDSGQCVYASGTPRSTGQLHSGAGCVAASESGTCLVSDSLDGVSTGSAAMTSPSFSLTTTLLQ